jgi:hypothetical protein
LATVSPTYSGRVTAGFRLTSNHSRSRDQAISLPINSTAQNSRHRLQAPAMSTSNH